MSRDQQSPVDLSMSGRTARQKISQFVRLGLLGGGVCGGLLLQRHDPAASRSLSSILHKFLDAEDIQRAAVFALSRGWYFPCRLEERPELRVKLWGLDFSNPVGIAAGFDKHGEAVQGLRDIGFGFVEVGSVTPEPQESNRLALLNINEHEYGVNSEGPAEVRRRLERLRAAGSFSGVLGVNLGTNKASASAAADFSAGVREFSHLADYLVISISRPGPDTLTRQELASLVTAVLAARQELGLAHPPPLLLSLAADLTEEELHDIAEVTAAADTRVEGLVVRGTAAIRRMYALTRGRVAIVGAGGVASGEEAWQKVLAGASLVQVRTGLVQQGPALAATVRRELEVLVREAGYTSIQEAVGASLKHSSPELKTSL